MLPKSEETCQMPCEIKICSVCRVPNAIMLLEQTRKALLKTVLILNTSKSSEIIKLCQLYFKIIPILQFVHMVQSVRKYKNGISLYMAGDKGICFFSFL